MTAEDVISYGGNWPEDTKTPERDIGNIKPDTNKEVFFYEQEFYVLSNFSSFNLRWENKVFMTSEHAYQWEKFNFYSPRDNLKTRRQRFRVAYSIWQAPSAHMAYTIAQQERHLRRPDWDNPDVKVHLMRSILVAKALQHGYVYRKLLETGDRELIEDSWRDDFWGWGPNRTGKNMLGKLWMDVREELRGLSLDNGDVS
jgi:ribA/ribD-fused uncharacterized protein